MSDNELSEKGQAEPLNLNIVAARALELIDFALIEIKEYGWYQGGAYGPGKSVCFDQALHSAMVGTKDAEVDKAAYMLIRKSLRECAGLTDAHPSRGIVWFNDKVAQTSKDIREMAERTKEYINHNWLGD